MEQMSTAEVIKMEMEISPPSMTPRCCNETRLYAPCIQCLECENVVPPNYGYFKLKTEIWKACMHEIVLCERCMDIALKEQRKLKRPLRTYPLPFASSTTLVRMEACADDFSDRQVNTIDKPERTIACYQCKDVWHVICAKYIEDPINPKPFVCHACYRPSTPESQIISFIPHTELSAYIERCVNQIVPTGTRKIHVRTISNTQKTFELSPTLANFMEEFNVPRKFPFMSRMIFCFQDTSDGGVTAFFGMCTQEYGENCKPPNHRTVYLAMIDSVHLVEVDRSFKRFKIYFTVILSYLKLMALKGFLYCYLWGCPPPSRHVEYIFNRRPEKQNLITPTKLRKFYHQLLTVGTMEEGPIKQFMSLHKYLNEIPLTDVKTFFKSLPLCLEDHWPDALTRIVTNVVEGKRNSTPKPKKKISDHLKQPQDWIRYDVMNEVSKYQSDFYFAKLKPPTNTRPISDVIHLTKFDTRDKIVEFFRENELQFCDIRSGVYTTKKFLLTLLFDEPSRCGRCNRSLVRGKWCSYCKKLFCEYCDDMYDHEHADFILATSHVWLNRGIVCLDNLSSV